MPLGPCARRSKRVLMPASTSDLSLLDHGPKALAEHLAVTQLVLPHLLQQLHDLRNVLVLRVLEIDVERARGLTALGKLGHEVVHQVAHRLGLAGGLHLSHDSLLKSPGYAAAAASCLPGTRRQG